MQMVLVGMSTSSSLCGVLRLALMTALGRVRQDPLCTMRDFKLQTSDIDTLKLQSWKLQTLKLQTSDLDTLKLESWKLQTLELQTSDTDTLNL